MIIVEVKDCVGGAGRPLGSPGWSSVKCERSDAFIAHATKLGDYVTARSILSKWAAPYHSAEATSISTYG